MLGAGGHILLRITERIVFDFSYDGEEVGSNLA